MLQDTEKRVWLEQGSHGGLTWDRTGGGLRALTLLDIITEVIGNPGTSFERKRHAASEEAAIRSYPRGKKERDHGQSSAAQRPGRLHEEEACEMVGGGASLNVEMGEPSREAANVHRVQPPSR